MKRLLLLGAIALSSHLGFAQTIEALPGTIINDLSSQQPVTTKTVTCGPDTVQYALAKASALSALSINNATSATSLSQYYNAPQAITISGAEFYAYKIDAVGGITANVNLEVYLAGADSMPTGAPLASTVVAVDTTFGGGLLTVLSKTGNFTPITLTQPYCVVVSNNSSNSVGIISNSYTAGDGQQEWLSSALIGVTWLRSYNVVIGGTPYDADVLIHPFVTYDLSANFTTTNACLTAGPTASFTNTSSPVLFDRMYSQAQFQSVPEASTVWNYGDGSPLEYSVDGLNAYGATGNVEYDVTLSDTLYGWTVTCADDTTQIIGDSLDADWSEVVGGGNTVTFTDMSYSTAGIASYSWDFGDGNTSTVQNPVHVYAAAGTYTVCLTVTSNCGSTDVLCEPVTIVACPTPTPAFSVSTTNYTADFTNTSTASPPVTYLWDFGDGNTSTSTDPMHTYAATGVYTVCLTVADACGADSVCQAVTIVCPVPTPDYTFNSTLLTTDFTNTSTVTAPATYLWDYGDGNTSTQTDPSYTYAASGTYAVCLTVADACGADSTCQTVVVSDCVNPVASFTVTDNEPSYDFTNTSTTTGTVTYDWDMDDGTTYSTMDASHTYTSNGTYIVTLTVTDSCGSNSTVFTIDVTTVGLEDVELNEVELFPNPTTGLFVIETTVAMESIQIFDMQGKLVKRLVATGTMANVDAQDLADGSYMVRVNQSDGAVLQSRLEILK